MNILVLNGSPKVKFSVTLQHALYLEKRNSAHTFTYYNAAQKVKALEKDFTPAKEAMMKADAIIFLYPVYTLLLPYQLQRFIELMSENNISLEGKYVTQITTSKHFFDTTAHKYLEENVLDFGCNYLPGLSADMEDLLEEKGRAQADSWFDKFLFDISIERYTTGIMTQTIPSNKGYQSTGEQARKTGSKRVIVLTNYEKSDTNLQEMIKEFQNQCPHPVTVKNLREFPFQGGCIGCLKCAVGGDCFYKDNFQDYLRDDIQTADAIIYAFTISHHYTHSSFKCYDDRQFCNGHRAVTHGMPVGYIISGEYSKESNLQTLVEARSEVGQVYLAGVVTDEGENLSSELKKLALSLDYALTNPISKPSNFYGVGGTKIFRDMVYLMQGLMKADHKFYKEHGIYDFPHNNRMKMMQMKLIGFLLSLPDAEKKMKGSMSTYILMPYEKILEETTSKS